MDAAAIATVIKEIGFPIFVACYVLIRMEKQLKTLTSAINNMTRVVSVLSGMKYEDKREDDDNG